MSYRLTADRSDPRLGVEDPEGAGLNKAYLVLSAEERAKGFVRPVRHSYRHVGIEGFKNELRDLTDEERSRFAGLGYAKYEAYPESESPLCGRYWKQADIDAIGKGCGAVTTMSDDLAETYARNPHFYGATFCATCRSHFPVGAHGEFVWDNSSEKVGT